MNKLQDWALSIVWQDEHPFSTVRLLAGCLSHFDVSDHPVQAIDGDDWLRQDRVIYHTRPIVSRGCGWCLWIALGRFKFGNIHALCDVTMRIQTAWRHNADACCHNCSSLATALSATPLPCRVPLNGMFQQDSTTQWNKLQIWKICNYE